MATKQELEKLNQGDKILVDLVVSNRHEEAIFISYTTLAGYPGDSPVRYLSSDGHCYNTTVESVVIPKPEPKLIGEVAWFIDTRDGEIIRAVQNRARFNVVDRDTSWQRVEIKDGKVYEWGEGC